MRISQLHWGKDGENTRGEDGENLRHQVVDRPWEMTRSGGDLNTGSSIKLGALTNRFSGEFTFPIAQSGSAGFTHVITYCDAFRVNFGAAELRNP
ncbi:MAG: DM13 domain-containing protein [Acidimicrobiia bacterium]|nr:DM13 domain-containing protein [Acidimicrobiia bacterium]